jgi:Outer membrane protein beta-barrel domain
MNTDMKNLTFVLLFAALITSGQAIAQRVEDKDKPAKTTPPSREDILEEKQFADAFARKKFRYGISLNMYWSSIVGNDLPEEYFWKPSLGSTIHAQYNFKEWIGVSAGVGFQQSGGGIINNDVTGGAFSKPWIVNRFGTRGDPDSTYLQKLRFNNIDIPVAIELRTPKDVLQKGWRLSGSVGLDFMKIQKVNKIWQSIVDGFHDDHYITENYISNDLGLQGTLGFDVDSGTGQMFQCQFVWMKGFNNVYKVDSGDGRQSYLGLRFTWLY